MVGTAGLTPSFAVSPDGYRIAYDVTGRGPAIMLLHGGGHTRRHWHEAGYVDRLKSAYTVIGVDIRGNGDSDKPVEPACYATDRLCQDFLAVADACGVDRFAVWGYSYGGNIGRYLGAGSDRVSRLILIGITFGPAASGDFRQALVNFCDHWRPIALAEREGTLDVARLSEADRDVLRRVDIPLRLAWLGAILDWAAVEPADMRCPTLCLAGSQDAPALKELQAYDAALKGTRVQVRIVEGLDHVQEFLALDRTLPVMLDFMDR
jgi:pimeloyl-ACP methyl ester carboxylesterase